MPCAPPSPTAPFIGPTHLPITQEGGRKFSGAAEQSSIRRPTRSPWQVPLASSTSHCQGSCGLKGHAQDREPGGLASSEDSGREGASESTWSDTCLTDALPLLTGSPPSTSPSIFGELLGVGSHALSSVLLSYSSSLGPNKRSLRVTAAFDFSAGCRTSSFHSLYNEQINCITKHVIGAYDQSRTEQAWMCGQSPLDSFLPPCYPPRCDSHGKDRWLPASAPMPRCSFFWPLSK